MSRDFFRNRSSLRSIPQMPAVTPVFSLTKNLTFDVATDLTSNFTQVMPNGTQTVTGGVVQFRNSTYDKENSITSNWAMNKILVFYMRINWWASGSASSYWCPGFNVQVLNSSNAIVTSFYIGVCFNYTYNEAQWDYWNNGYIYWKLGTDAVNQALAISHRLCSVPSTSAQHTYELIDVGGGYIQFKLDGVVQGANMYLGDPTYKLGSAFYIHPLGGWYNNSIYADIDTLNFTYINN
jgi:hypothetical protein